MAPLTEISLPHARRLGMGQRYRTYNMLRNYFPEHVSQGILANIDVETDGTYDPHYTQYGGGKGYGLFQFEPPMLKKYNQWKGDRPDTALTQIEFAKDVVEGKVDHIGRGNVRRLQKAFSSESPLVAMTAFMDIFEKPGKPQKEKRLSALQSIIKDSLEGY